MNIGRIVDAAEYPCEVYHEVTDTVLYTFAEKKQIEHHHTEGAGITTIVEGIMGFASTHNMETLQESCILSQKCARHGSTPRVLPHPVTPAVVPEGVDQRIVKISQEDIRDIADKILADIPPFCDVTRGNIMLKTQKINIVNSNGVDVKKMGTFAVLDVAVQDKNQKDLTFYSCYYSRTLDMEWPLTEEVERWHKAQNMCECSSGESEVILSPLALSRILDAVFVPVICRDLPEAEKMLHSDVSEIDVFDHGLLEGGMGSAPFDAEGVPQKVTPLIEKGHFTSFLYDTTSAHLSGEKSTGNAYRESFEDAQQIYITNVCIPPVCKTEDLISDIKEGIWVSDIFGASITHPPSGEFVSTISQGYRIKKGEITGMIPPKMMEGSISSLLEESVPGDDAQRVDRYVVPSSKARVRVY